MKMHAPLMLDLPPDLLSALRTQARSRGRSPSAEALRLLALGLSRDLCETAEKTPSKDERAALLLAPIRGLLAADLAQADSWDELQTRLSAHGYTFRERGGDLALYCTATAARICMAPDLGWTYSALMRRFDRPFPGHSQIRLADHVLKRQTQAHPSLFPDPDDEDELVLIEDD